MDTRDTQSLETAGITWLHKAGCAEISNIVKALLTFWGSPKIDKGIPICEELWEDLESRYPE